MCCLLDRPLHGRHTWVHPAPLLEHQHQSKLTAYAHCCCARQPEPAPAAVVWPHSCPLSSNCVHAAWCPHPLPRAAADSTETHVPLPWLLCRAAAGSPGCGGGPHGPSSAPRVPHNHQAEAVGSSPQPWQVSCGYLMNPTLRLGLRPLAQPAAASCSHCGCFMPEQGAALRVQVCYTSAACLAGESAGTSCR